LDCAVSVSDAGDTSSSRSTSTSTSTSSDDDGCLDAFLTPDGHDVDDGYGESDGSDVSSLAGSQVPYLALIYALHRPLYRPP